jgi:LDH2 family malate/lactate/ureidoglycolate dehydrogenase
MLSAKHGLVAIHTAASSPLVAPPGGIRPVLGTNPIAIAVPSSRGPIVLDMGTSAYLMTEVMLRERLGELLPEGVALGPGGEPTRESNGGTTRRLTAVRRLQRFRACAHGAGAGTARRFWLG